VTAVARHALARTSAAPRVAIDLRILDAPLMERSGMGRYAIEIVKALRAARPDWRLDLFTNRAELVPREERTAVHRTRWPTHTSAGRVAWLHLAAMAAARRAAPDVWFSPSYVLPLLWRGPSVVTVHDLTFDLLRARYPGRLSAAYVSRATRWSAHRAARVLCGSEETKARLVEHLSLDGDGVRVIPYGVAEPFLGRPVLEPDRGGDFLLFVGDLEARKGLDVLLEALRGIRAGGRRAKVVVAGRPGRGTRSVVRELRREPEVDVLPSPDDETLSDLYRRALALVYPSLMEGFGLPVAEAMAAGCPVVASDLACVREFAADVPLYAPPGDAKALTRTLVRILDAPELRGSMSRRGPEAVAGLRWPIAGERTAVELEQAMAASRS
jgi:glycosyltransferase involved in cell wall biosynthesis